MQTLRLNNCLISATPQFLKPYWAKVAESPIGNRLVLGAFWSLVGTAISRGLGLISSIIVARMLGRTCFGELGMIQSTVGLFGTFAGFGMGLTATKFVAEFRAKDPARAGRIIGLSSLVAWGSSSLLAALLALLAPWLATHTLAAPHLARLLTISSLLLLLSAVNGAQTGALAGFEAFKRIAQINSVVGVGSFPLMVAGAWLLGLEGVVWGLIVSQAVNLLLNSLGVRSEARRAKIPLAYFGYYSELAVVWRFSLPSLLSGCLVAPVYWLCNTLIVNQPDGYAQMGIFNAANQWFAALLFLPIILGQAALPLLCERHGEKDTRSSRRVLGIYIRLNVVVAFPLVLLGSLGSPYIMASYGKDFAEAWLTLVVVLLTAGLLAIQIPVGMIITASGRMWLGSLMNLGWAVCFILATWLLVRWGALGLATARLVAYIAHAIWTFSFAAYLLGRSK